MPTIQTTRTTILLVHANAAFTSQVKDALKPLGYRVLSATSGASAAHVLTQVSPHVVMLDADLPDTHGISLLALVRARTDAPVILSGSEDGRAALLVGLELGASDILLAPFNAMEMKACIETVLRQRSPDTIAAPTVTHVNGVQSPSHVLGRPGLTHTIRSAIRPSGPVRRRGHRAGHHLRCH